MITDSIIPVTYSKWIIWCDRIQKLLKMYYCELLKIFFQNGAFRSKRCVVVFVIITINLYCLQCDDRKCWFLSYAPQELENTIFFNSEVTLMIPLTTEDMNLLFMGIKVFAFHYRLQNTGCLIGTKTILTKTHHVCRSNWATKWKCWQVNRFLT